MAAIGSIRKHSTILLVVVAVALLAFLLGDFTRKNQGNKFLDKFITIGKENISYPMFLDKYDGFREMYKKDGRTLSPDEDFRIGMQVYDELVDSIIFAKQAGYLGITVTPEELRDLITGPNPHPDAFRFFTGGDPANFERFSQIAPYFIENIEVYRQQDSGLVDYYLNVLEPKIEKDAFMGKYLNLLSGAYYMPKAFAQKMADEASLKADLEVIQIPYTNELVSDDKISFTEDEVKKYYEENKYRFKQDDEFRNVEYVVFPIEPTEEDLKNIEENVREMFEEFSQTDRPDYFVNRLVDSRYDSTYYKRGMLDPIIDTLFDKAEGSFLAPYIDGDFWVFAKLLSAQVRPDSINFSFIRFYSRGTQENQRKEKETELRVDTAYNIAKTGIDFYELAKMYSDDQLPEEEPEFFRFWMEDGGNEQMFFDTLYKFAPGSIVKYELPNVTYLFKINEKTAAERKIRVAIGRKQIIPSSETVNNIESAANNFVNGTDTYQKFADAVAKYNLDKRANDRVRKMDFTLPSIREGGRDIVRWIFDENTTKDFNKNKKAGTVSHVFSLEDMYVVVVLKDIYPEGYMTLEQEMVRNHIEMLVKRDKKAEKLESVFKEQLSKHKTLEAISEYNEIDLNKLTISFADRNFGYYGPEMKLIGKLFGQGQSLIGKIEIMKGDWGVYAVKVNKIDVPSIDATSANNDYITMLMHQHKMTYQNTVMNRGTQFLRKMYKIQDNRNKTM